MGCNCIRVGQDQVFIEFFSACYNLISLLREKIKILFLSPLTWVSMLKLDSKKSF